MRKMASTLLMLLALAGALVTSPRLEAKASLCTDPGCTCRCECGQLLKCCGSGSGTTCEPAFDVTILCPQIACP
jgi:hypothetical protein